MLECILKIWRIPTFCGVWSYYGNQRCDFMLFDLSRKSDRNIVDNGTQV